MGCDVFQIYEQIMKKITVTQLETWLGRIVKKHKMNYKSYNKFSVVFNQLYKYCQKSEYFSKNPFDEVKVSDLQLRSTPKKVEQIQSLFQTRG